jgi:hypothetical protein
LSTKKKRLERIRKNRNNVSFDDFVSVLEYFGFNVRTGGKESHRIAKLKVGEQSFSITFVKPHGNNKFMHPEAVKDLLAMLDKIETALSELEEDKEEEDTTDE